MCDPELGALEDIRGDISVPLVYLASVAVIGSMTVEDAARE